VCDVHRGVCCRFVYVRVIRFKKHAEINFCHFFLKFCRRMLHGSGCMRFEVFQDGEDSACGRVICSAV
jgi:quinol monooxygenase YgiN